MKLSTAQRAALERAASRPGGYVCPTSGLHGNAQEMVLQALARKGLITNSIAPTITDNGREAIATEETTS